MTELKRRLLEISDCEAAVSLLFWDQATYMPPGGVAVRVRQISTLSRLTHEKSIDPDLGKLLDKLVPHLLPMARNVRLARPMRIGLNILDLPRADACHQRRGDRSLKTLRIAGALIAGQRHFGRGVVRLSLTYTRADDVLSLSLEDYAPRAAARSKYLTAAG